MHQNHAKLVAFPHPGGLPASRRPFVVARKGGGGAHRALRKGPAAHLRIPTPTPGPTLALMLSC